MVMTHKRHSMGGSLVTTFVPSDRLADSSFQQVKPGTGTRAAVRTECLVTSPERLVTAGADQSQHSE
jgi:hypothetical protein